MTGYKDQTWCSRYYYGDCKNTKCMFALTQQEKEKATTWWGSVNFPVSVGDRMDNGCGYIGDA